MNNKNILLRQLPKTDRLITDSTFAGLNPEMVKNAARKVLDEVRKNAEKTETLPVRSEIVSMVISEYERIARGTLFRVINATGVTVHTNLGRAPIDRNVMAEASELVCGYSNLEYDTAKGRRGDRYHHISGYLRSLTGAEDAVVVNNNASAVFLILNTFAKNREVIVSRGELVEIGGSFRIPDVMKGSGAKLIEVGTTNKTRISDYSEAVSPKTAMMMKVHKSNYEIVGFSEEASLEEIAGAASQAEVISCYDAGSGLFRRVLPETICPDRTVPELVKIGFDLISFSGDKMLGGPQAGIIAGKKELIAKIKKNPLMRMLRVDKITIAVLQATLRKYMELTDIELPVSAMLADNTETLRTKAEKLANILPAETELIKISSTIGGGSCPLSEINSWGVALNVRKPQQTEKRLRGYRTPVIARITDDRLVLDVRTIDESEFETVRLAVESAL